MVIFEISAFVVFLIPWYLFVPFILNNSFFLTNQHPGEEVVASRLNLRILSSAYLD